MPLDRLNQSLEGQIDQLHEEGRAKDPEHVIVDYLPPEGDRGPRYKLRGTDQEFIRLNSNSYLSLSNHPELIEAADEATEQFEIGRAHV